MVDGGVIVFEKTKAKASACLPNTLRHSQSAVPIKNSPKQNRVYSEQGIPVWIEVSVPSIHTTSNTVPSHPHVIHSLRRILM